MGWWGRLRPWLALVGPLMAVVVLTAAPAGVKDGELPWPKWLVAGLVAAGGVLVAVWTPLVKARTDALAARTTRAAERDARGEDALHRLPTRKGRVQLVEEVTDRALLGIHEAIPLPADRTNGQGLSAELPTYVARDIDADLRTALEARRKTGGFVLLVGPAASGKTRCVYEAIRAVLPRGRLFMPGDAATLTELVTGGANLKHGVVWLNETQNFLTGPDRLKAATVRRLLADSAHPVILIGTIWPTTYDQLRTPAAAVDGGESEDLNKDSRDVLELARRFSLGSWSEQEWARAGELTSIDPRIERVTRHRGQAGLTQLLSAAPELIHRWEQADSPFGQAVITAAVIARRCGHPDTVPSAIVEALALECLTGPWRAAAKDSWFPEALTWACQPVHHSGGIAPLQACAKTIGQIDGYQVSDILVDHASPSAPASQQPITSRVWTHLTDLAAPEACLSIGIAAYRAGQSTHARTSWQRAADAGHTAAMHNLGFLLAEQGDTDNARTWYTRAADAGHTDAMVNLGILLKQQGDTDNARTWYTRAIDAGDTDAMYNLGNLLAEQGDTDNARTWYTRAIDAGDTDAMYNLGILLAEQGDTDNARTWYTRAADAGHTAAMYSLGILLAEQGDTDNARTWYTRAADAGHTDAMVNLGILLKQQGDTDNARTWYTRAIDAGDTDAMYNLGILLAQQGDTDNARTWYTRAADAGHTDAMYNLGILLAQQGDTDGARTSWQRAADAGHTDAADALATLMQQEDNSAPTANPQE
ncbi:tetratricopeptide repeat protein [Streptomyces cylindrosporus]|uniref:Tetratricopeptide repeat protein n=1 Tax=Streptomyces cylindrosporus TaxID=2927583 RepID=A0ABS9XYY6_9ACTN|nr:tetratricopeptide repeat protein [Streptomyces cylindrosporus]MCI3269666.1 tetratricopeptide repeat protein [Streptomyces cylindrosporus]